MVFNGIYFLIFENIKPPSPAAVDAHVFNN